MKFKFWKKDLTPFDLQTKIEVLTKEIEVLWRFEQRGGYAFGKRDQIVSKEKELVKLRQQLKQLRNERQI